MTQQKFTEVLTEFLDARDNLAHWNQYQQQWPVHAERLTKAGERLNAIVPPGVALQQFDPGWPWPSKEALEVLASGLHGDVDFSDSSSEVLRPPMQYSCYVEGCGTRDGKHNDCACWHDEGTGKYSSVRFSTDSTFNWREKPAQADDAEVRVEAAAPNIEWTLLDAERLTTERTSSSRGPKTNTVMLPRELPEMTEEEFLDISADITEVDSSGVKWRRYLMREDVGKIYSRIVEKFGV